MEEKKITTQQNGMTRRSFMKGAAASVAAISFASVLPANEVQAAKKVKKNGIYIEGGNTNLTNKKYSLEFIQPVQLVAYIDGKKQTEGTWRSANKHLVSVDPDGTVVLRDGVGGYTVAVTWTLGSTTYKVSFITQQTIGAHCIDTDLPITRGDFMIMLSKHFGWAHYNAVMDDGTDIDDNGNILKKERVRNYYDVTGNADYVKPIESALDMGVLSAASSSECFYPQSYLTREDAAVILKKAFLVEDAEYDALAAFTDKKKVSKAAYAALNALVAKNAMQASVDMQIQPTAGMSISDARIAIQNLTAKRVSPVWSMPVSNRKFVRCRPLWQCPTEGATIHWRAKAFNISDERLIGLEIKDRGSGITLVEEFGKWFDYIPGWGTVPMFGLNNCFYLPYDRIWFCLEVEAYATKEGMEDSPVSKFIWRIDRPAWHDFAHDVLHEGNANFPTVHRYFDNFQAAAYYIEGSKYGVIYDGLCPTNTRISMVERVKEVATKPFVFVLGHNHPDHKGAMAEAYKAGVDIYCASRATIKNTSWSINYYEEGYTGGIKDADDKVIDAQIEETIEGVYEGPKVHELEEGDVFDLGNCKLKVYRLPGHEDGQIVLHDAENGIIYSSDIYGVNRYWVADQFGASGVKQDLVLSLQQQLMVAYRKNGGQIKEVYTGHNRTGVGAEYLRVWENAFQNVTTYGFDALSDDYRGDGAIVSRDGNDLETLNWQAASQGSCKAVMQHYESAVNEGEGFDRYEIDKTNSTLNLLYPDVLANSALSNLVAVDGNLIGHDFNYKAGQSSAETTMEDGSLKYIIPNKFVPMDTEYTVEVKYGTTRTTLIPYAMSTRASITVNGQPVGSRCPVKVDTDYPATIIVTAVDGSSTEYTIKFKAVRSFTEPKRTVYTKKNAFSK